MTAGSSMLAMILSVPPQGQVSISIPNTRFSRRAQLIATCRGVGAAAASPATEPPQRTQPSACRRYRGPQPAVRREDPVVAGQMHPPRRHQRREARHQIQRLEHEVRRAIAVRGLERVAHLARWSQCQPLAG
jgi:hypothetical protein